MCIAIVRVKYRVKETVEVDCDTEETLAERLISLEGNDEVVEFRVFRSSGKRVRITAWEDRA